MSLEPNKVVTFNYSLKDSEGTLIETTENKEPLSFISGSKQILPKLEEAISKMIIGSKKDVKLSAADAYGEFDEKAVQQVKRNQFPEELTIEVGMSYIANSQDGEQTHFVITDVKDDDVTIDFNHQLAGKDLEFNVELLDVRNATEEELNHGHVHGPGGHQH
jgi:FKBP-type peptidyl-prolyl cis-trans isomerase SlyD